MTISSKRGLTVVEVMIAILVFATGALGLAATSAAVVRQLTSSVLRTRAANLATSRDEMNHAVRCSAAMGSDFEPAITSTWAVTAPASRTLLSQTVQWRDSKGLHTDTFLSAAPCD